MLLGHSQGFQIWSIASEISEMVAVKGLGHVTHISLLPTPLDSRIVDVYKIKRPLVVMVEEMADGDECQLRLYSLSQCEFVNSIEFSSRIQNLKTSVNYTVVVYSN